MAKEERSLESTTRAFDTVKGTVSYAELSDSIAPHLLSLLDAISDGEYASRPIDINLIQEFHFCIIGEVMPKIAGKWRTVPVQVGNHFPPEPYEIPVLMTEYARNLQTRLKNAETLELQLETLAYAEGEFLHIHPFADFNGRTIRALLRELMLRLDFPPIDTSVKRDTPRFRRY